MSAFSSKFSIFWCLLATAYSCFRPDCTYSTVTCTGDLDHLQLSTQYHLFRLSGGTIQCTIATYVYSTSKKKVEVCDRGGLGATDWEVVLHPEDGLSWNGAAPVQLVTNPTYGSYLTVTSENTIEFSIASSATASEAYSFLIKLNARFSFCPDGLPPVRGLAVATARPSHASIVECTVSGACAASNALSDRSSITLPRGASAVCTVWPRDDSGRPAKVCTGDLTAALTLRGVGTSAAQQLAGARVVESQTTCPTPHQCAATTAGGTPRVSAAAAVLLSMTDRLCNAYALRVPLLAANVSGGITHGTAYDLDMRVVPPGPKAGSWLRVAAAPTSLSVTDAATPSALSEWSCGCDLASTTSRTCRAGDVVRCVVSARDASGALFPLNAAATSASASVEGAMSALALAQVPSSVSILVAAVRFPSAAVADVGNTRTMTLRATTCGLELPPQTLSADPSAPPLPTDSVAVACVAAIINGSAAPPPLTADGEVRVRAGGGLVCLVVGPSPFDASDIRVELARTAGQAASAVVLRSGTVCPTQQVLSAANQAALVAAAKPSAGAAAWRAAAAVALEAALTTLTTTGGGAVPAAPCASASGGGGGGGPLTQAYVAVLGHEVVAASAERVEAPRAADGWTGPAVKGAAVGTYNIAFGVAGVADAAGAVATVSGWAPLVSRETTARALLTDWAAAVAPPRPLMRAVAAPSVLRVDGVGVPDTTTSFSCDITAGPLRPGAVVRCVVSPRCGGQWCTAYVGDFSVTALASEVARGLQAAATDTIGGCDASAANAPCRGLEVQWVVPKEPRATIIVALARHVTAYVPQSSAPATVTSSGAVIASVAIDVEMTVPSSRSLVWCETSLGPSSQPAYPVPTETVGRTVVCYVRPVDASGVRASCHAADFEVEPMCCGTTLVQAPRCVEDPTGGSAPSAPAALAGSVPSAPRAVLGSGPQLLSFSVRMPDTATPAVSVSVRVADGTGTARVQGSPYNIAVEAPRYFDAANVACVGLGTEAPTAREGHVVVCWIVAYEKGVAVRIAASTLRGAITVSSRSSNPTNGGDTPGVFVTSTYAGTGPLGEYVGSPKTDPLPGTRAALGDAHLVSGTHDGTPVLAFEWTVPRGSHDGFVVATVRTANVHAASAALPLSRLRLPSPGASRVACDAPARSGYATLCSVTPYPAPAHPADFLAVSSGVQAVTSTSDGGYRILFAAWAGDHVAVHVPSAGTGVAAEVAGSPWGWTLTDATPPATRSTVTCKPAVLGTVRTNGRLECTITALDSVGRSATAMPGDFVFAFSPNYDANPGAPAPQAPRRIVGDGPVAAPVRAVSVISGAELALVTRAAVPSTAFAVSLAPRTTTTTLTYYITMLTANETTSVTDFTSAADMYVALAPQRQRIPGAVSERPTLLQRAVLPADVAALEARRVTSSTRLIIADGAEWADPTTLRTVCRVAGRPFAVPSTTIEVDAGGAVQCCVQPWRTAAPPLYSDGGTAAWPKDPATAFYSIVRDDVMRAHVAPQSVDVGVSGLGGQAVRFPPPAAPQSSAAVARLSVLSQDAYAAIGGWCTAYGVAPTMAGTLLTLNLPVTVGPLDTSVVTTAVSIRVADTRVPTVRSTLVCTSEGSAAYAYAAIPSSAGGTAVGREALVRVDGVVWCALAALSADGSAVHARADAFRIRVDALDAGTQRVTPTVQVHPGAKGQYNVSVSFQLVGAAMVDAARFAVSAEIAESGERLATGSEVVLVLPQRAPSAASVVACARTVIPRSGTLECTLTADAYALAGDFEASLVDPAGAAVAADVRVSAAKAAPGTPTSDFIISITPTGAIRSARAELVVRLVGRPVASQLNKVALLATMDPSTLYTTVARGDVEQPMLWRRPDVVSDAKAGTAMAASWWSVACGSPVQVVVVADLASAGGLVTGLRLARVAAGGVASLAAACADGAATISSGDVVAAGGRYSGTLSVPCSANVGDMAVVCFGLGIAQGGASAGAGHLTYTPVAGLAVRAAVTDVELDMSTALTHGTTARAIVKVGAPGGAVSAALSADAALMDGTCRDPTAAGADAVIPLAVVRDAFVAVSTEAAVAAQLRRGLWRVCARVRSSAPDALRVALNATVVDLPAPYEPVVASLRGIRSATVLVGGGGTTVRVEMVGRLEIERGLLATTDAATPSQASALYVKVPQSIVVSGQAIVGGDHVGIATTTAECDGLAHHPRRVAVSATAAIILSSVAYAGTASSVAVGVTFAAATDLVVCYAAAAPVPSDAIPTAMPLGAAAAVLHEGGGTAWVAAFAPVAPAGGGRDALAVMAWAAAGGATTFVADTRHAATQAVVATLASAAVGGSDDAVVQQMQAATALQFVLSFEGGGLDAAVAGTRVDMVDDIAYSPSRVAVGVERLAPDHTACKRVGATSVALTQTACPAAAAVGTPCWSVQLPTRTVHTLRAVCIRLPRAEGGVSLPVALDAVAAVRDAAVGHAPVGGGAAAALVAGDAPLVAVVHATPTAPLEHEDVSIKASWEGADARHQRTSLYAARLPHVADPAARVPADACAAEGFELPIASNSAPADPLGTAVAALRSSATSSVAARGAVGSAGAYILCATVDARSSYGGVLVGRRGAPLARRQPAGFAVYDDVYTVSVVSSTMTITVTSEPAVGAAVTTIQMVSATPSTTAAPAVAHHAPLGGRVATVGGAQLLRVAAVATLGLEAVNRARVGGVPLGLCEMDALRAANMSAVVPWARGLDGEFEWHPTSLEPYVICATAVDGREPAHSSRAVAVVPAVYPIVADVAACGDEHASAYEGTSATPSTAATGGCQRATTRLVPAVWAKGGNALAVDQDANTWLALRVPTATPTSLAATRGGGVFLVGADKAVGPDVVCAGDPVGGIDTSVPLAARVIANSTNSVWVALRPSHVGAYAVCIRTAAGAPASSVAVVIHVAAAVAAPPAATAQRAAAASGWPRLATVGDDGSVGYFVLRVRGTPEAVRALVRRDAKTVGALERHVARGADIPGPPERVAVVSVTSFDAPPAAAAADVVFAVVDVGDERGDARAVPAAARVRDATPRGLASDASEWSVSALPLGDAVAAARSDGSGATVVIIVAAVAVAVALAAAAAGVFAYRLGHCGFLARWWPGVPQKVATDEATPLRIHATPAGRQVDVWSDAPPPTSLAMADDDDVYTCGRTDDMDLGSFASPTKHGGTVTHSVARSAALVSPGRSMASLGASGAHVDHTDIFVDASGAAHRTAGAFVQFADGAGAHAVPVAASSAHGQRALFTSMRSDTSGRAGLPPVLASPQADTSDLWGRPPHPLDVTPQARTESEASPGAALAPLRAVSFHPSRGVGARAYPELRPASASPPALGPRGNAMYHGRPLDRSGYGADARTAAGGDAAAQWGGGRDHQRAGGADGYDQGVYDTRLATGHTANRYPQTAQGAAVNVFGTSMGLPQTHGNAVREAVAAFGQADTLLSQSRGAPPGFRPLSSLQ